MTTEQTHEPSDGSDEFYIGYASSAPPRLARFVTRAVGVIGVGVTGLALLVAAGHRRLEGGVFEFGHPQTFTGTIVERPYPALKVDGSGDAGPLLLLVAPGKHGAESLVAGLDGRHVSLRGTRIVRDGRTMAEAEGRPVPTGAPGIKAAADDALRSNESVQLTGEVVDSKCFMGVMVPGDGKTHRDCASLCLRGGIPPALLSISDTGERALVLLAGASGAALGPQLNEFAGDTVVVTGSLHREGEWPVLHVESVNRR